MPTDGFSRGRRAPQRLLSRSSLFRRNAVLGYAVGLATFIVALAARVILDHAIPQFPFITFIPAVIISAFLAGSRAGWFCGALSFVATWYWFVHPTDSFATGFNETVGLSLFVFIIVIDIALIAVAARAVEELTQKEGQLNIIVEEQRKTHIALEEALKAKELLLHEVNHRVKNSLHLVNSFLFLEALKIDDSEAQSAVMAARSKVDLIARVHQLLYLSGNHNHVDMKTAIEEIVTDLIGSAGRDDVSVEQSFSGDLMMSIGQASPLVLVVNEIITNALKYGLSSNQPKLTVSAASSGEEVVLVISDNGPGIAPATPDTKSGLGRQIMDGLVHQMRGEIAIQSDGSGTTITLTIPTKPLSSDIQGVS
ncbi:MAG: DUF4118 domain-containing protein [Sphingomonadales bacterium]|nr:DUF4118 domain-containing protein [Sphingomonadales bacterium]NCQ21997.1 DUF4118 domain-containing protein [Sphingomonadales bacterium]NCT03636.1 DUF4118 domain-containing protein [Sphingomonadales bacterium]